MAAIMVTIALIGVALVYVYKEIRWIKYDIKNLSSRQIHYKDGIEKQIKEMCDAGQNMAGTLKDFSNSVTEWADSVAEWSKHEDDKINKNSWILQKQISEIQKRMNRETEEKTEKE